MSETSMSDGSRASTAFRLSQGGLIYRLGQRARIVEAEKYHLSRQVLVALTLAWLPLVILSAYEGMLTGSGLGHPFLHDMVPNVRFLIAVPLLVTAEAIIDPLVNGVIQSLASSGVLPESQRSRYEAALNELTRRRDSVWADLVMIALAVALAWTFKSGYDDAGASSWLWSADAQEPRLTPAGWWYLTVSAPLFIFVLSRWLWRFAIWAGFLYRISRIPLALQPAHPDLAGGLGMLSTGQNSFAIVFVAFAAVVSATLAHDILFEGLSLTEARPVVIGFVLSNILLLYGPLLFFLTGLASARLRGRREYSAMGYRLSHAFNSKWIRPAPLDQGKDLMGSVDSSAMADYMATYEAVRDMRVVPITLRSTAVLAAVLAAPFLPLYLTEVPIGEALSRLFGALV